MGRERFDAVTARIPAQITSALARAKEVSERRRLSHEQGSRGFTEGDLQDGVQVIIPPDPRTMECLDTRVFNQSITRQWVDDANPREDAWSPRPSRIDPST